MEDADWNITIDNNVTGTANAVRAFAPYIVKRGGGRIILTSSTQGRHGTLYGSAYSASKWAIIGLMKSAALELGRYKITVNALIPGLIDTPLTRHEERYAQAIQVAGGTPTGSIATTRKSPETVSPAIPAWRPMDRSRGCCACGGLPRFRRRAHGFGRRLLRHRGRQREHYGLIARRT